MGEQEPMGEPQKGMDVLGLAPLARSVELVTTTAMDAVKGLATAICKPAAEELGLYFRDRVRLYRAEQLARLSAKTQAELIEWQVPEGAQVHPRVAWKTLDEGSWTDDDAVQEMWAGLLAASCSADGKDQSNLVFVQILSAVSPIGARILNHACEKAEKILSPGGLMEAGILVVPADEISAVAGESDITRLDAEMDHLRVQGLIRGGFEMGRQPDFADVTPTSLALHMYVRCKGFRGSPGEFYGLAPRK